MPVAGNNANIVQANIGTIYQNGKSRSPAKPSSAQQLAGCKCGMAQPSGASIVNHSAVLATLHCSLRAGPVIAHGQQIMRWTALYPGSSWSFLSAGETQAMGINPGLPVFQTENNCAAKWCVTMQVLTMMPALHSPTQPGPHKLEEVRTRAAEHLQHSSCLGHRLVQRQKHLLYCYS